MRGRPGPSDLWGKFRSPERGGPAWHPLVDHATDVACVLEALLAQPTIRHRLTRAGGQDDLDAVQVARLCFLAFLHDLGKCNRDFRAKAAELPARTCGHIRALKGLCADDLAPRFQDVIDLPSLAGWGEQALHELLHATFAHHGRPVELTYNAIEDAHLRSGWLAHGGDDPIVHLAGLVARGRCLFPQAFASGARLPTAPPFQHLFAGLLMLADWLGSGDSDTMFPYTDGGEDRLEFARQRAASVLREVGIAQPGACAAFTGGIPSFAAQFEGRSPRSAQAAMDSVHLPPEGGIMLLESETGSGKTEAALRWATRLIAAGRVDGLFFAVPLRSAAVQLHGRVQRWLEATFPEQRAQALLAVPGYFRMGEVEGRCLPDFAVQWTDGLPEDRRLARWAAEQPKRYAAATFAVGTVDQALLAVLRTAHAHLRAACLVRHLLVVDEVHSSDPYMRELVLRLVDLFRACGGQVLLMSATLGAEARELLLQRRRRVTPLAEATAVRYPLVSLSWGEAMAPEPERRGKEVLVELRPWLDRPEAVADCAARAVTQGAKVLVLRNTVSAAIAVQQALEQQLGAQHRALFRVGDVVTMHHGRFAAEDRRLLDAAIEARTGAASPPDPLVVVTTQTIEQSLDVDFDLLLTDLCPIDVLLQRIGRLHRHMRARPAGFESARCLVLEPACGDLSPYLAASRHGLGFGRDGQGRAYPDLRAAEATRRLIGAGTSWVIPRDNRCLVEQGTHPEALQKIEAKGDAWCQHGTRVRGIAAAQGGIARDNAIDFSTPFSKLAFPAKGIEIATRLGLDDLLLPLDRPLTSPFGQILTHLRLPGWMVRRETWQALAKLDEPHIAVTDDGELELCGQGFDYGRLGLRPTTLIAR